MDTSACERAIDFNQFVENRFIQKCNYCLLHFALAMLGTIVIGSIATVTAISDQKGGDYSLNEVRVKVWIDIF